MPPSASGSGRWLLVRPAGSVGVTEDGRFIARVRFKSDEDTRRNTGHHAPFYRARRMQLRSVGVVTQLVCVLIPGIVRSYPKSIRLEKL